MCVGVFVGGTCRTTSVLSLHGVEEASSPSSWTTIVFTDSVSPLLSLDELEIKQRRMVHLGCNANSANS